MSEHVDDCEACGAHGHTRIDHCEACGRLPVSMVMLPGGKRYCMACATPIMVEHDLLSTEDLQALRAFFEASRRAN